MRMVPTIGRMLTAVIVRPFLFQCVAAQAEPMIIKNWMAPNGMLKRMASKLLYPKSLTMRLPKVATPPLAMLSPVSTSQALLDTHRHAAENGGH